MKLREEYDKKGMETPIIALIAFNKGEITEEAIQSGINDIVVKPFEAVQLFTIINYRISGTKIVI